MSCSEIPGPHKFMYIFVSLIFGAALIYAIVECILLNDTYYPVIAYKGDGILAIVVIGFITANLITTAVMFCVKSCNKIIMILNVVMTVLQFGVGIAFAILTRIHSTKVMEIILANNKTTDLKVAKIYNQWLKSYCKPLVGEALYNCAVDPAIKYVYQRTGECSNVSFAFHGILAIIVVISIIFVRCKSDGIPENPKVQENIIQ